MTGRSPDPSPYFGRDEPTIEQDLGELGALLLDAGMSVTDVRTSLEAVSGTVIAAQPVSFAVLPEAVWVTRDNSGESIMVYGGRTELSFRQAAAATRLAQQAISATVPAAEISRRIAQIRAQTRPHPVVSATVGNALIAGGLAIVFRCPWWSILVAAAVGTLVGVLMLLLGRVREGTAITPFVAAFTSTLIVGAVAGAGDFGSVPLFGVCAPVAILVPGLVITNALLELTSTDIVTGASRLLYGVIMLGFMAAGISAGAAVTGLRIDPSSAALVGQIRSVAGSAGWQALPPVWMSWVGVIVIAVGLGLAFGSGPRLTILTVIVMLCTYGVLTVSTVLVGSIVATGVTAAVLFIGARVIEGLTVAVPATVSFQPAYLLLVPGTVGLVALAALDTNSLQTTPAIFASLCIGIKVGALIAEMCLRPLGTFARR
ncbi:threonine/serine exporter family protein [Gordonia sp. CPCC 205515]|uniref:threonine/serine exporter family protein n=1 Tax=Gordonia sp. CPCC 205515 TaxID=3140791 RepID=UPI003AF37B97